MYNSWGNLFFCFNAANVSIFSFYKMPTEFQCIVSFRMPHWFYMIFFVCYLFCRFHTGVELLRADSQTNDTLLKLLWHHSDAIMCCSLKASLLLQRCALRNLFSFAPIPFPY